MQRLKRIITVTAVAATITAASAPSIASAATNTGGTSKQQLTKQQVCEALPGIVNTLGAIAGSMDLGSAAQRGVQAVQQAIYDAGSKACPS